MTFPEDQYGASKLKQMQAEQTGATQGMGIAGAAPYYGDTCATKLAEDTRSRLMRRLRNGNEEHQNLNRAIRILESHPEFEDLIWLIRSGLI